MSGSPPGMFGRPRVRPRAMTTDDLIFVVVGVILSVLLGLTGLFWAAGKISGRLHSGRWPDLAFSDTPAIVVGTIKSPDDPAAAFPASARSLIPGPGQFWGITVFLFLLLAAIVIGLIMAWFREGGLLSWRGRSLFGRRRRSENWARLADIQHLLVDRPETGRLTLGRMYGHLVAAERGDSLIVLGPTGSGRTSSFAIPSILEWQGPVVAVSMTQDLILDTIDRRLELGAVHIYDPTASIDKMRRSGWTPLAQTREWAEALRTAGSLASAATESVAARRRDPDLGLPDASSLIAPLLFAAAKSGLAMADVVRWVQRREHDQVEAALEAAGEPAAADAIEGVWRLDERQQSELYHAAQIILSPYADPLVAESSKESNLTAEALLDGGFNTAYLTAPAHEMPRMRPLFSALLHEVVKTAGRLSAAGRGLDPPLLLVLDGAADVGAMDVLDTYGSTAADYGVQLVSIFQDLSEIRARYGERADTILNNHRAKVIMSGTAGTASINYVATLLSDEEIQQVMQTYGEEGFSSSEMSGFRRVTPADMLREIQLGEGLLVYGSMTPAELKLRPWYRDNRLLELAGKRPMEPPPTAKERVRGLRRLGPDPGQHQQRPAPTPTDQPSSTRPRLGGGIVFPDEGPATSIDLAQPAPPWAEPSTQELPRVPADPQGGRQDRARRDGSGEAR